MNEYGTCCWRTCAAVVVGIGLPVVILTLALTITVGTKIQRWVNRRRRG